MRRLLLSGALGLAVLGVALATPGQSQAHDPRVSFSLSIGPGYGYGYYPRAYYPSYYRPMYGGSYYYAPAYYAPTVRYVTPYRAMYPAYDYYYMPRARVYYHDPYCW